MNNNLKTLCLLAAGAFGVATQAQAALFSGEVANLRDATGALVGDNDADATGNAWAVTGGSPSNKGVRLSYTVDKIGNTDWAYSYTFVSGSGAQKQVGHFDLEVGSAFTAGSLLSVVSSVAGTVSPTAGVTSPTSLSELTGAVSSPGSKSLFGLQWVFPDNTFAFTVTLHSTLGPIWGDFIVRSKETTAGATAAFLTAWNHGLGTDVTTTITTGNDAAGYVLVPGAPAPVPLPAALPMLLGACAALGWARRKAA